MDVLPDPDLPISNTFFLLAILEGGMGGVWVDKDVGSPRQESRSVDDGSDPRLEPGAGAWLSEWLSEWLSGRSPVQNLSDLSNLSVLQTRPLRVRALTE